MAGSRFVLTRPLIASIVALALIATSCTSGGEGTGVFPTTSDAAPSTSTAPSTTTTTTLPYDIVPVTISEHPEVGAALSDLYTWLSDPLAPQPNLPDALATHLADGDRPTDSELSGTAFVDGVIGMGLAGVALVGDDTFLLVNDALPNDDTLLTGWRVVGASMPSIGVEPWYGETIRRVMIIGTDAREWQDAVRFRGDSLHIITSNTDERGGGVLGFPRDSWIEAPYGFDKFTHVNAITWTESDKQVEADLEGFEEDPYLAHAARWLGLDRVIEMIRQGPLGGEVTVDIAEEITGLEIEGYILTGFKDFALMLNDYGSIMVDIPFAMADGASGAFFSAGLQELYGKAALAFARNRHIGGGDFTRSFHQGLIVLARLEGFQETGLAQLPFLVSALVKHTWTDLSLEQLVTLGGAALLIDPENVGNAVVPGFVATRSGRSVVIISDSAEELYRDLDDGVLEIDA